MTYIKRFFLVLLLICFAIPQANAQYDSFTSSDDDQVYGPSTPTSNYEEEVIDIDYEGEKPINDGFMSSPVVIPDTPPVTIDDTQKINEVGQSLNEERDKLQEVKKTSQASSQESESIVRIPVEKQSKEAFKAQRKEKRFYGMTLTDLSSRWNQLKEKIADSDSGIEAKNLSRDDKKVLKGQIKYERKELQGKFPNLDKGFFKEKINKDIVISREDFLSEDVKSLQQVVERSLEVFIPIQIAKEKEKTAKLRYLSAMRELIPEFNVEISSKKGSLGAGAFNSDNWRVNLKQPIFRGGNLWNTFKEESANLKASKEEIKKSVANLILDVSEAYLNYARAQSLFKIKVEFASQVNVMKLQNEEKKKAGVISEIEYLNTDSLLGEFRADLESAYQELAISQLDLVRFLGVPSEGAIEVESIDELRVKILPQDDVVQGMSNSRQVENLDKVTRELDALVNSAYQNRSDLRLEELKLLANRHKFKAERAKLLPSINFIVETGQLAEAFQSSNDDPPFSSEFRAGFEMDANIFGSSLKYEYDTDQRAPSVSEFQGGSGTRTNAHKFTIDLLDALEPFVDEKEARIQMMEQMVELQEKENEVLKEVKETYYELNRALIQLDSAIKKMGHRERVSKLKFYQLGKNQIQISEYLQAEKDLLDAKSEYTQSVADYITARITLNKAVGRQNILQIDLDVQGRKVV